ncbi:MAG: DUF4861 domain-containing protein [Bacteroidales bacterium]|nr:DUF4861 domain-containing protein [Bacteroidales bacterium]
MEGPVWENDKIAFRNYFDARNGMDIFGKRVSDMCMDSVGLHGSYHELDNWGMDILKVGNSLGAGSIGLLKNDSLYRLGLTENAIYELVSEGPIRSVFRLIFSGWETDQTVYSVVHEISIWGGANFYKSDVTISGLKGGENLITGIVNMQTDTFSCVIFKKP